jgi:adenylyltransferase/sulfurtransferase
MMLSNREKMRYRNQLSVKCWNQKKLKHSKVSIVGVGGLGSASALYLAAAGVGKIRLCDGDKVEPSDLNRQVLYFEDSIGNFKVEEAKKWLLLFNPDIEIETIPEFIDDPNTDKVIEGCDLIIDGLDNNESRFLLNHQSVKLQIPYVYGAVQGWEGFVGFFHPPQTACLACFLKRDDQKMSAIPVPGVLPGTIGLFQATEALKYIMGIDKVLKNSLLIYDSRNLAFDIVEIEKNPNCSHCAI